MLSVLKNRAFGNQARIGLDSEPSSRRYYKSNTGDPHWRFGWKFDGGQISISGELMDEDPFGDRDHEAANS